jgi:hypothetical protein
MLSRDIESPTPGRFYRATLVWATGIVGLVFGHWLVLSLMPGGGWSGWGAISLLAAWFGLFLPFTVIAGGMAAPRSIPNRSLALRALLIAVVAFGLGAYVEPFADHQDAKVWGVDIALQYPLGPLTPEVFLAQRELIRASPPDTFDFRIDQPFQKPPNWLTYLFHSLFVVPIFALFAAFLGREIQSLTSGLSPPSRRNTRWALGLFSGIAFFIALVSFGEWVRLDPSRPGVAGAWGPLLVPLLELGLFYTIGSILNTRRASQSLDGSP